MIFYQVLGTSSDPCCLVGTQVDAKRLAKERGTSFEQVDVPTDKPGLMAYVNQLKSDVSAEMHREPTRDEMEVSYRVPIQDFRPPTFADVEKTVSATPVTIDEATDVEDFILNRASIGQVENIFACLGTRFKELAK